MKLAFNGDLVMTGGIIYNLMIGRIREARSIWRPGTTWLKDLATQANFNYNESITIPRDRNKWRRVGNSRRTPCGWAWLHQTPRIFSIIKFISSINYTQSGALTWSSFDSGLCIWISFVDFKPFKFESLTRVLFYCKSCNSYMKAWLAFCVNVNRVFRIWKLDWHYLSF